MQLFNTKTFNGSKMPCKYCAQCDNLRTSMTVGIGKI